MEDLILKDFTAEVKAIEGERALNVTITTNTIDRSGDIVEPKGGKLTNFRKNPVVLMAHDYQGLPIGKASNLEKTENGINAKVTFPEEGIYPLADTVYNMYKQKYMRAWSIGFIPIKSEDIVDEEDEKKMGRGRRFKIWELLEFSACAVPNNPDVSTNMMKKGIDIKPLEEAGFITIIEEEEKTKYNCECIDCGHKVKSKKHCKDLKCPECGGTMRREERPGPGEETYKATRELIITMGADEISKENENKLIEILKGHPIETEEEKATNEELVKKVITEAMKKDIKIEEIDIDKFMDFMKKDEKEELSKEIKLFESMVTRFLPMYLVENKQRIINEKLYNEIKDIELKAGAVLNAKNKSNLKNAQAMIQSVLDSAGEEEGQEGEKVKTDEKDDIVINLTDTKKEDPPKDEKTEEKTIIVDEKVISKAVAKAMNYALGITDK